MKRIFTLAVLAMTIAAAQAQDVQSFTAPKTHQRVPARSGGNSQSVTAIIDTNIAFATRLEGLGCGDDSALTIYGLQSGGSASGTNGSGFKEFGQKFRFPGAFHVIGASAAINVGSVATPTLALAANAYRAVYTRAGTISYIDTTRRITSDSVFISALTTNRYNDFNFVDTTTFRDSVILTVTIPSGADGDTMSIFTTAVGCTTSTGHIDSYTLQRGQRGVRLLTTRITGFAVDMAMFAILEYDDTPVANLSLFTEATRLYPQPSAKSVMVVLPANAAGNTAWQLFTPEGKAIRNGAFAGVSTLLERGDLNGVYILRMSTAVGPITKRVVFAD